MPSSYAFSVEEIDGIMDKQVAFTAKSDGDELLQLFLNNLHKLLNKFMINMKPNLHI